MRRVSGIHACEVGVGLVDAAQRDSSIAIRRTAASERWGHGDDCAIRRPGPPALSSARAATFGADGVYLGIGELPFAAAGRKEPAPFDANYDNGTFHSKN